MAEWFAANWPWLLAAVAYAVGRVGGVPEVWRTIARAVIEAVEAHSMNGIRKDTTTDSIKKVVQAKLGAGVGVMEDALAAVGDKKHKRNVLARVLDVVSNFLPLVGTLRSFFRR